ncbi:hypothetical protein [Streptoalloteichus tenebrarius]|uniref:hypothetical protein n=1 Tax=Streptoalloteichus tenebrarius (strain ATCC 17920 / DSM 40477 / JCM 4838 / CBS 697.72 / NBRC 16177 / NCIMB 11028 / NRRL B-12390 / A12253. 1 / ISP 5477) TaxID=1933 RepID=UPI0020A35437|nr:hypothetical protein [Streptoalloteichus tenebrarius]
MRQIRNLAVVMSAGAALAIAAAGTAGAEQPSNRFGVGDAAFGPKGITTDHASLSAKGIRAVLDYPTMAEQAGLGMFGKDSSFAAAHPCKVFGMGSDGFQQQPC